MARQKGVIKLKGSIGDVYFYKSRDGYLAGSALPLFLVFGVEFYQEVNGNFYPLKNGAFDALALVVIDTNAA